MRNSIILGLISALLSCSTENEKTNDISNYVRMLDEQINGDLMIEIYKDSIETMELYNLIDETINEVVNTTGGFNLQGELINGQKSGLTRDLLTKLDFFDRVNDLLEKQKPNKKRYDYIKSGLYMITQYWPEYGIDKLTVSETYMGLALAQNRVLTSNLID